MIDLDHPRFAYGPGQATDFIPSIPATPYTRGLGAAVGGDIDGDSGIRAAYVIYQLELLAFAIRYHETEWPALVAFIEAVQDGQSFLFFPINGDDTVFFWVTLESPAIGTAYSGQPDGNYPQALALPIIIATQDSFDTLVPLPLPILPPEPPPPEPIDPTVATMTVVSESVLHLSWVPVTFATGYIVLWHNGDGISTALPEVDALTLSYDFTGLPEGTVRFARVYVKRNVSFSAGSNIVSAKTLDDAPIVSEITGIAANDIHLAWTDESALEVGYQVQRSVDGGAFADLGAQLPAGTMAYIDLTADVGHLYTYRVAVIDDLGRRNYSNLVSVTPLGAPTASMIVLGETSLRLMWDAVPSADGYRIAWHNGGGVFANLPDVGSGVLSYDFTGLTEDVSRYAKVFALRTGSVGPASNVVNAKTLPAAPVLTLTRVSSNDVGLSWTDASAFETGYQVQRSTDGGAFANIGALLAPGTIVATDATAADGHQYRYRIQVTDGTQTNLSNVVTANLYLVRVTSGCLFRDDFNRPDAATAGTDYLFSAGGSFSIVANRLRFLSSSARLWVAPAILAARKNVHMQITMIRQNIGDYAVLTWRQDVVPTSGGGGTGGSAYFQFDMGTSSDGNTPRLNRSLSGGFAQIGARGTLAGVNGRADRYIVTHVGNAMKCWVNDLLQCQGTDSTVANDIPGQVGVYRFGGFGTVEADNLLISSARLITCPNLPAGYRLRLGDAGGALSDVSAGGGASVTLDPEGAQMPYPNVQVIDGSGNLVHKFLPTGTGCGDGLVGGDTLNWTGPVVPPPVEVEVGVGGLGPPAVYDGVTVGISPYYVGMNTAAPFENLMNSKPNRPDGKVDTTESVDVEITFSSAVSKVTITSYDVGNVPDPSTAFIIAYNAANVELGRTLFVLNGLTHRDTRSVEFPGIRKVVLQHAVADWVAYEHLKFYH